MEEKTRAFLLRVLYSQNLGEIKRNKGNGVMDSLSLLFPFSFLTFFAKCIGSKSSI